nr:hypothetical protein CFP56_58765 [Quercus suber]
MCDASLLPRRSQRGALSEPPRGTGTLDAMLDCEGLRRASWTKRRTDCAGSTDLAARVEAAMRKAASTSAAVACSAAARRARRAGGMMAF